MVFLVFKAVSCIILSVCVHCQVSNERYSCAGRHDVTKWTEALKAVELNQLAEKAQLLSSSAQKFHGKGITVHQLQTWGIATTEPRYTTLEQVIL